MHLRCSDFAGYRETGLSQGDFMRKPRYPLHNLPIPHIFCQTSHMRNLTVTLCLTIAVIFGSKVAYAFCSPPSAPQPPSTFGKPDKPSTPFCINEIMRTHTCSEWEISSYRNDMDNYRSELEDYVQKLKYYAREAQSFSNDAVQ